METKKAKQIAMDNLAGYKKELKHLLRVRVGIDEGIRMHRQNIRAYNTLLEVYNDSKNKV